MSIARKFRKRPVVIEAIRWDGADSTAGAIFLWAGEAVMREGSALIIPTLEGSMRARIGDWIIKGVAGEFYPCDPDIFAKTYEPTDD